MGISAAPVGHDGREANAGWGTSMVLWRKDHIEQDLDIEEYDTGPKKSRDEVQQNKETVSTL